MPLMSPGVQAALRKAGVEKIPIHELPGREEESITEKLHSAGLSLETTLENLATIANGTGNEGLKLRANETALKLHGALKESNINTVPSFTIVIQDPGSASQTQVANPIFLPRQLHQLIKEQKEASN